MKKRAAAISIAVSAALVAGGSVAYATSGSDRPFDETVALDRLRAAARNESDLQLVDWIEELTAPEIVISEPIPLGGRARTVEEEALFDTSREYIELIEDRQVLTRQLAELWMPNEKRYHEVDSKERQEMITDFVSKNRSSLERLKVEIEQLDRKAESMVGSK